MQGTLNRDTREKMLTQKLESLVNNSSLHIKVLRKSLQEIQDMDLSVYSDEEIENIYKSVHDDAVTLERFEKSTYQLINGINDDDKVFIVLASNKSKSSRSSGSDHSKIYRKNVTALRPVFTNSYEVVDFMAQDPRDVNAMFCNSLPGFIMMNNVSHLSRAIPLDLKYANAVREYGTLLMNAMGKNNVARFTQTQTQEITETFVSEIHKIVERRMTNSHENDVKFLLALKAQPYNLVWIVNYAMSNTDLNLAEVVDCVYKVSTVMFSRTSNRIFTRLVQSEFPMSFQETKLLCDNYHMIKDLDNDTIRSLYGTV